jgi:hypothetical protein
MGRCMVESQWGIFQMQYQWLFMPLPDLIWNHNVITIISLKNHIKKIHLCSKATHKKNIMHPLIDHNTITRKSLENHMEQSTSHLNFGYDPMHINGILKYKSNIHAE